MAEVMSLIMMVFMIVPVIAPGTGQIVMLVSTWHMIFGRRVFFGYVVDPDGGTVWFANVPRPAVTAAERAATSPERWQRQLVELFAADHACRAYRRRRVDDENRIDRGEHCERAENPEHGDDDESVGPGCASFCLAHDTAHSWRGAAN